MSIQAPAPPSATTGKISPTSNATFTFFNLTYGTVNVGVTSLKCHKIFTLYPPKLITNPQSSQVGSELTEDESSQVGLQTTEDGSYGRCWKRDGFRWMHSSFSWVCDSTRHDFPANWKGVWAIEVLAQEVYIAPNLQLCFMTLLCPNLPDHSLLWSV